MENIALFKNRNGIDSLRNLFLPLMILPLLFLYFSLANNFFLLIFLALASILIFVSKPETSVMYLLFFSFFSRVLKFTFSGIEFSFLLDAAFIFSILFRKFQIPKRTFIPYIFFFLYFLITFNTQNGHSIITNLIQMMKYLVLLLTISRVNSKNTNQFIISAALGFFFSSILGLFKEDFGALSSILHSSEVVVAGQSYSRFSGITYDTNLYAFSAITIISCLLVMNKGSILEEIVKAIVGITIFSFGLLTYSKMFVLASLILFLVFFVSKAKTNFSGALKLAILTILVLFFVNFASNGDVLGIISARFSPYFSSGNLDVLTTERTAIWRAYFNIFMESPQILIFGSGINGMIYFRAAHNTFLELVSYFGLFGSSLFLFFLIRLFNSSKGENKMGTLYGILPTIILSFCFFALSLFTYEYMWAILFLCIVVFIQSTQKTSAVTMK